MKRQQMCKVTWIWILKWRKRTLLRRWWRLCRERILMRWRRLEMTRHRDTGRSIVILSQIIRKMRKEEKVCLKKMMLISLNFHRVHKWSPTNINNDLIWLMNQYPSLKSFQLLKTKVREKQNIAKQFETRICVAEWKAKLVSDVRSFMKCWTSTTPKKRQSKFAMNAVDIEITSQSITRQRLFMI